MSSADSISEEDVSTEVAAQYVPDQEMSSLSHWAVHRSGLPWGIRKGMNAMSREWSRPVPQKQQSFARALGWFSIALGAAELLFPNKFSRLVGVNRKHDYLVRFLGLRELAAGVGILSQLKYPSWVWSRVVGDVMDLALLGAGFTSGTNNKTRLLMATGGVLGATALDLMCGEELMMTRKAGGGEAMQDGRLRVKKSITINRSPEELYSFWRNFENLPRFMNHLQSVRVLDGKRSSWKAKGPLGKSVEWEAEMIADRPNELIAWRSLPGSQVYNSGVVTFEKATGGRGTVVRVEMSYRPPAGSLGVAVAQAFRREPGTEVQDSLRYFKQIMETGSIPTTVGQSAGRRSGTSKKFDLAMPQPSRNGAPQFQPAN